MVPAAITGVAGPWFSELLELAESGSELTVTRHGTPVARLAPIRKQSHPEQRKAAIQRWRKDSKNLSLRGLKTRDLLEEGHP